MGVSLTCDGCGDRIEPGKEAVFGLVRKREYCDACSWLVLAYVRDRDLLHTQLAKQWYEGVARLRCEFAEHLPKGTLPDE
jgi:hypothetical protein